MPVRRGRPPKAEPGLSRQGVLDAGLRLVHRDGLDALTMRALAAEVDVRATSLYRYVRNKNELLAALADAELADLDLCRHRAADWRVTLHAMGVELRRYLLARRDAARLVAGRFTTGPHGLGAIESVAAALRAAGLTDRDAAYAVYTYSTALFGFVAAEQTPMSAEVAEGMPAGEYLTVLADRLRSVPPDRYPSVLVLADELTGPGMDARFEFLLDRLIDGLLPLAAR